MVFFQFLLACNAGLMTGASYEELFQVFAPFGQIEEVQLMPNKSYSFVTFEDLQSAAAAFEAVHGKHHLQQNSKQPHSDQVKMDDT